MMRQSVRIRMGMLVLWAAVSAPAAAQDLLVPPDWVVSHLDDPNVVLLHVGAAEDYAREHLPGAHFVAREQMAAPQGASGLVLELPDAAAFQETLRGWGVRHDSRIVVYWGSEWVTPTTRFLFTLDWAGLGDRTVVMDGGLGQWKAAGYPVTDDVPEAEAGNVTVTPRDLVVEADWVRDAGSQPDVRIVDARAAAFFDGVREDRGRSGHIPGAVNVPWRDLVNDDTTFKTPEQMRSVFAEAGVGAGDTVVAYCHIGQYATAVIFAARLLGHEVRLYDGAFQDWAARGLPVEGN